MKGVKMADKRNELVAFIVVTAVWDREESPVDQIAGLVPFPIWDASSGWNDPQVQPYLQQAVGWVAKDADVRGVKVVTEMIQITK
jgi:hypothetical protein